MSLCPICGKVYCDHSSQERGQTLEEMMLPLTDWECEIWERKNVPGSERKEEPLASESEKVIPKPAGPEK